MNESPAIIGLTLNYRDAARTAVARSFKGGVHNFPLWPIFLGILKRKGVEQ